MNRRDIDAAVFDIDSEEETIATLVATGVFVKHQRTGRGGSSSGKRANLPRDLTWACRIFFAIILENLLRARSASLNCDFECRGLDNICGVLICESVFVRKEDALGKKSIYHIQRLRLL
jgi:hypothetical protein